MAAAELFGPPGILLGGERAEVPQGKTSALLYYLAYHGTWVRRDDMLYLFWPDKDERKARANLRQLLHATRKLRAAEDVEATPTHLRWRVETDVGRFRRLLDERCWSEAVRLYRGPLLAGFGTDGVPEFGSWLEAERAHLFERYRDAVFRFAETADGRERPSEVALLLKRLHAFEPFDEPIFERYLRHLASNGRSAEALRAFGRFARTLELEVGCEPAPSLRRFADRIRSGGTGGGANDASRDGPADEPPRVRAAATVPTTPFVGREAEANEIIARLDDPACRLLTLVAPGGMGKTRLALEVAARLAPVFEDGSHVVAFEAVAAPDLMATAVAEALDYRFAGRKPPRAELIDHLASEEMLLVLDNLEHLLPDAGFVADLLVGAPGLKLLATSRESLGLQSEWRFDLKGMRVPDRGGAEGRRADSVALFVQRANMAGARFVLDDANEDATLRLCRATGGMPLALELAAGWMRVLGPEEILAELERDLGILRSSETDRSPRHLDIRTVFETSWSKLPAGARAALLQLAVFDGGFSLEAARDVTNVGLPLLLLLVNKAFLRRDRRGRFTPHPLLWQFVRQKSEGTVLHADARERHARYFAAFAEQRTWAHRDEGAARAREEIDLELPNVRRAWRYATEHLREDLLGRAGLSMFFHFLMEARFAEGAAFFEEASRTLRSESLVHARVLHHHGALLNIASGRRREESRAPLERSLTLTRRHRSTWDTAHALLSLGYWHLFSNRLDRDGHARLWRECAELFEEAGDRALHGRALAVLALHVVDPAERGATLRRSLAVLRGEGSYHELADTLRSLAQHLVLTEGGYRAALPFAEESVALERSKGNTYNLSSSLVLEGTTLLHLGRLDAAEARFLAVRALGERAYRGRLVSSLNHLIRVSALRGRDERARAWFGDALGAIDATDGDWAHVMFLEAHGCMSRVEEPDDASFRRFERALAGIDGTRNVNMEVASVHARAFVHHGRLLLRNGEAAAAERSFLRALRLARRWRFRPATLHALCGFAALYRRRDRPSDARVVLDLVLSDDAVTFETRDAAARIAGSLPGPAEGSGDETPGLERVCRAVFASGGGGDGAIARALRSSR